MFLFKEERYTFMKRKENKNFNSLFLALRKVDNTQTFFFPTTSTLQHIPHPQPVKPT